MYQTMEKKKNTREKIVDAAIELFKINSYDQVTVKDICTLAGVTRNSFYYYFDSKDAIFDAIGDWCSRTAKQRLPEVFSTGSTYQQVWEIYRLYLETQIELGPEIMNHVCASRTMKGSSDYYSFIDNTLESSFVRLIRASQSAGIIRNDQDPTSLLWTSYAIVRGINIKWCFLWGECDLIRETREAMDTLFLPVEGSELR